MRRGLWVVLALVVGAGCSKCGDSKPSGPTPVQRVLPKGAVAVAVVPSLESFGRKLRLLEQLKVAAFLAPTQGFGDAQAFADALVGELGVDVRSKEALEGAGLDGARALGVAALVTGQVILALPVKDAAKFHHALEVLSMRRLGAGAGGETKVDGVVVKTFAPQAGAPPRVGYVLTNGFALVATDDGVAKLQALARLGEGDSLMTDARLPGHERRLSGARDVWAWLPGGSPLLARLPLTSLLVSASLEPTGLTVAFDGAFKPDAQARYAMLEPKPGQDLAGFLPRDAFLVARFNGEPAALAPFANELFGPWLLKAFSEGGLDLKSEALAQVKPGVTVSLSLAERPPLGQGVPELDLRRTNPFTWAHLSGVAVAKSKDDVVPVMDKVAALAPRFGAELKKTERDGVTVFLTTYAQGEGVHFAVRGEQVFFASPLPRLRALVDADGKAGAPVKGLTEDALSVVVDLRKLAASVRALPESAWGIGGFAMKGTTVRWLDATDDLVAVSASVGAREGAVQGRVVLSLAVGASAQ